MSSDEILQLTLVSFRDNIKAKDNKEAFVKINKNKKCKEIFLIYMYILL